jgi:hypothetical protein
MGIELTQKEKEELLSAILFFLAKADITEELRKIMENVISKIENYKPQNS